MRYREREWKGAKERARITRANRSSSSSATWLSIYPAKGARERERRKVLQPSSTALTQFLPPRVEIVAWHQASPPPLFQYYIFLFFLHYNSALLPHTHTFITMRQSKNRRNNLVILLSKKKRQNFRFLSKKTVAFFLRGRFGSPYFLLLPIKFYGIFSAF